MKKKSKIVLVSKLQKAGSCMGYWISSIDFQGILNKQNQILEIILRKKGLLIQMYHIWYIVHHIMLEKYGQMNYKFAPRVNLFNSSFI